MLSLHCWSLNKDTNIDTNTNTNRDTNTNIDTNTNTREVGLFSANTNSNTITNTKTKTLFLIERGFALWSPGKPCHIVGLTTFQLLGTVLTRDFSDQIKNI